MKNYIDEVLDKTRLNEGRRVIENILIDIYIQGPLANKELAQLHFVPIPLISSIKKEFIKLSLVKQESGAMITDNGIDFVENSLGFKGINREFYLNLINDPWAKYKEIEELTLELEEIFMNRPSVDVTVDQCKGTVETAINRAILAVSKKSLIGKNIVFLGDDDFTSVAMAFLLKKILSKDYKGAKLVVLELDERIVDYINLLSSKFDLNIEAHKIDFRDSFEYKNSFDTVFLDPPYTEPGLKLFLSRAVESLKSEKSLDIFLSYANKSPEELFIMQEMFCEMKLLILEIMPKFNKYEGASLFGNQGQMIFLNTTEKSQSFIKDDYKKAIYTGELRKTSRIYVCKSCKHKVRVGMNEKIKTIENLKEIACIKCNSNTFDLLRTEKINGDKNEQK